MFINCGLPFAVPGKARFGLYVERGPMSSNRTAQSIYLVGRIVYEHRALVGAIWLIVTLTGVGFAFLTPKLWPVTTALTVREETALSQSRPGEFASTEARRKAQETVLQLASSTAVLRDALAEVSTKAVTTDDIEAAQRRIRLAPPKGADWGASEVFYLTVQDEDSDRAMSIGRAMVAQIELRLKELRRNRTESLTSELEKSLSMAEADLAQALKKMGAMEGTLGPDLAEMRIMTEPSSGESNLRRTLTEVENELRQARSQIDGNRTLLELLESARQDPLKLIATPSRLLDSQPSLRKMKEGIVDAVNRTSQLLGNLHESHPKVKAAKEVERQARNQLHAELALAVEGVKVELQVGEARMAELTTRREGIERRLAHLAEVRAEYGLLSNQVKDRSDLVKRTRDQLAEVKSSRANAETASVLAMVDAPLVGLRPTGIGKSTICLIGVFAGFVLAGASLMLVTPAARWRQAFGFDSPDGRLEMQLENGVLAAWMSGAKPIHRQRLSSATDPSLQAKP